MSQLHNKICAALTEAGIPFKSFEDTEKLIALYEEETGEKFAGSREHSSTSSRSGSDDPSGSRTTESPLRSEFADDPLASAEEKTNADKNSEKQKDDSGRKDEDKEKDGKKSADKNNKGSAKGNTDKSK